MGATSVQVTSSSCAGASAGPGSRHCVFVLTDGERFRCSASAFAASVPTPAGLLGARSCARLSRLAIPAASRAVFAALNMARSCLTSKGLGVTGGPVFPPDPRRPDVPDGELIVGNGAGAAFVAFYRDVARARRLESQVARSATSTGGTAERHGAVTFVWVHPAAIGLRRSVQACVG